VNSGPSRRAVNSSSQTPEWSLCGSVEASPAVDRCSISAARSATSPTVELPRVMPRPVNTATEAARQRSSISRATRAARAAWSVALPACRTVTTSAPAVG